MADERPVGTTYTDKGPKPDRGRQENKTVSIILKHICIF